MGRKKLDAGSAESSRNATTSPRDAGHEIADLHELTALLRKINDRSSCDSRDRAAALIYDRLKSMARACVGKGPKSAAMEATDVVHRLYLRLAEAERLEFHDRRHFFALASTAMQQIIVDECRRRGRLKRGGDRKEVEFPDLVVVANGFDADLLDLNAALSELEAADERTALIVKLRFFAGLSMEVIADVLGVSSPTVDREWRFARAWLAKRLLDDH